jgi:predicted Zn-dependent protease
MITTADEERRERMILSQAPHELIRTLQGRSDADAQYVVARAWAGTGDSKRAARLSGDAARDFPDDLLIQAFAAYVGVTGKRSANRAIDRLGEIVDRHPALEAPRAWKAILLLAANPRRFRGQRRRQLREEAESMVQELMSEYPNRALTLTSLAVLQATAGQNEQALATIDRLRAATGGLSVFQLRLQLIAAYSAKRKNMAERVYEELQSLRGNRIYRTAIPLWWSRMPAFYLMVSLGALSSAVGAYWLALLGLLILMIYAPLSWHLLHSRPVTLSWVGALIISVVASLVVGWVLSRI